MNDIRFLFALTLFFGPGGRAVKWEGRVVVLNVAAASALGLILRRLQREVGSSEALLPLPRERDARAYIARR